MKVQDIMTRSVSFCRTDTDLAVASRIMWDNDCGILPVLDGRQIVVGVITDRDICVAVGAKQQAARDIRVGDCISENLYSCSPDADIKEALKFMQTKRVRRLPVIELDGLLLGIISISDVMLRAERGVISCEEIVETYKAICEPNEFATAEAWPPDAAVA